MIIQKIVQFRADHYFPESPAIKPVGLDRKSAPIAKDLKRIRDFTTEMERFLKTPHIPIDDLWKPSAEVSSITHPIHLYYVGSASGLPYAHFLANTYGTPLLEGSANEETLLQALAKTTHNLLILQHQPQLTHKVLYQPLAPTFILGKNLQEPNLNRILVPVDATPFSYRVIYEATLLAPLFEAELIFFHLSPPAESPQVEKTLHQAMANLKWPKKQIKLAYEEKELPQAILEAAQHFDVDLILMGTHSSWFNTSITEQICKRCPSHVLILHPDAQ